MSQFANTYTAIPAKLLQLLSDELPFSLPLLRRLQSTNFKNGFSSTARTIVVAEDDFDKNPNLSRRFTAAYVDVGRGRDTQMWLYSTLENPRNASDAQAAKVCEEQLTVLIKETIKIGKEYGGPLSWPDSVLLGTLHSSVREIMMKTGRVEPRPTGLYDKWLFKVETIPHKGDDLPEGMHWSTADVADCKVVISRTDIPRTVESLSQMLSLVIKLEDGTPISWAFLGFDGSLVSLHVEEPYRRKGLAKKLASKLFRERSLEFGGDGWSSADVSPSNEGSRGMCRSLGGEPHWTISWVLLNIRENESDNSVEK